MKIVRKTSFVKWHKILRRCRYKIFVCFTTLPGHRSLELVFTIRDESEVEHPEYFHEKKLTNQIEIYEIRRGASSSVNL